MSQRAISSFRSGFSKLPANMVSPSIDAAKPAAHPQLVCRNCSRVEKSRVSIFVCYTQARPNLNSGLPIFHGSPEAVGQNSYVFGTGYNHRFWPDRFLKSRLWRSRSEIALCLADREFAHHRILRSRRKFSLVKLCCGVASPDERLEVAFDRWKALGRTWTLTHRTHIV